MNKEQFIKITLQILRFLGLIALASFFIIDRLFVSFLVNVDMPGFNELLKFKHEQERFKKRIGFYGAILLVSLLLKLLFHLIF